MYTYQQSAENHYFSLLILSQTEQFVGSKYVKSNPKTIYIDIERKLQEGKKVLFVGLPCQVAALYN